MKNEEVPPKQTAMQGGDWEGGPMCKDPGGGESTGGQASVAGTQGATGREGKVRRPDGRSVD